jgi:signal transduction histidine kinase/ligand-binding sensor domain-containing protein
LDLDHWLGSEQLVEFLNEEIAVVLPEPIHKAGLLVLSLSRVVFLLFVLPTTAWAVDPSKQMTQYAHTAWRIQDGFLNGVPNAVAQTTDGYLWIGTQAGLMRFDGVRFVPWKPTSGEELSSSNITALLAARDGSLWIGTDSGLSHLVDGDLIRYPDRPGGVTGIIQCANGEIWFSHYQRIETAWGICKVVGAQTRCYYGKNNGVPLVEDGSGSLWTGTGATLTRWQLGSPSTYAQHGLRLMGAAGVHSLALARDGSIWVGMQNGGRGAGLQQFTNGTWKPFIAQRFDSSTLTVPALLLDRKNTLWVGTSQGLYRIRGRQVDHYGSSDGLSGDDVSNMGVYEDREGNIWVATSQGLDCFRDLPVTTYTIPEGWARSVLATRDGTIWSGSKKYLVGLRQERAPVIDAQRVPGDLVYALLEDHAGRLWVGVDDFLTIYKNETFRRIDKPDGKPIGFVVGMTEDVEHNIWVETNGPPRTLFRIQDFEVREIFPAPQMPEARRIAPDPGGGIWLGLIRGDLARYKNRKLEIYPFRHSAVPGLDTEVNQLLVTSEGAVLGATHFGMIAWRNGTQQTLTVQNGLPCDGVHALVFDNQGNLWLYLQCGLVEVPKTEMQKWWQKPDAVVHFRLMDSLDGVRPGQAPFAAGARSPDGRLWFANTYALQVVDPNHLSRNSIPPPVHVEEIIADRRSYAPGRNLSLPSLTRDLEIDYTALSFMAPQKVRFRYKLEDHDTEWQEPGSRRQAFYSDLRPGKYRFRVIACNNDGVWNEEGATLDFSVAPAWYQTIWFRVSCLGGLVLLLWALYQLRLQQLERQFGKQVEARVNERTRIARDLHDTLLQSFQGLLMRFQAVSNELAEGELKQELDEAIDRATGAITEGRDAVQGLRSSVVERNDLAAALGTLGKELAAPSSQPPEFTMQVEGAAHDLHPILRDEVYRVAGEALRNAFRHADARRIEVEIRYDERVFRLRVRDDGKGIGPNLLAEGGRAGHFGLRGMRERAKRVEGKLTVWSELGSGTEVELRVPASHAYTRFRPPHRSWLAEKFFAKDHEMKS